MKYLCLCVLLIALLGLASETNKNESAQVSEPDALLLEIQLLQDEIDLANKKLHLLEKLRTYYIQNNFSIPVREADHL